MARAPATRLASYATVCGRSPKCSTPSGKCSARSFPKSQRNNSSAKDRAHRGQARAAYVRITHSQQLDQGPCGHLLRDVFVSPQSYAAVNYLAGAEIAIDICQAIEASMGLDVTGRYNRATTPCVVEFWVDTSDFNGALAAALWYLEAGLRNERTMNANWSYCGDGEPLSSGEIVSVEIPPNDYGASSRAEVILE